MTTYADTYARWREDPRSVASGARVRYRSMTTSTGSSRRLSVPVDGERYLDFLANVGTEECNEALWAFQREALVRRDEVLDRPFQIAQCNHDHVRLGLLDPGIVGPLDDQ